MKTRFEWYIPLTEDETKQLWKKAILSVDTNVLLDLYRFSPDSREALQKSIAQFKERVVITNQAATEFIKNIQKVKNSCSKNIASLNQDLTKYKDSMTVFSEALKKLHKELPKQMMTELHEMLTTHSASLEEKIQNATTKYVQDVQTDSVLNWVTTTFTNKIREPISDDILIAWEKEANIRIENEIPPGYTDIKKTSGNPHGDVFLWKEILELAKEKKLPVILVTSEQKEDWWEKHSGEIKGPRIEMLKEAYDYSGQKILIYRTDYFTQKVQEYNKYPGATSQSIEIFMNEFSEILRAKQNKTINVSSQQCLEGTSEKNSGIITANIHKPTKYVTISGKLKPKMSSIPKLSANLLSPPLDSSTYTIFPGTGTVYDFNLHIKSENYLPEGKYVMDYLAECNNEIEFFDEESDDVNEYE